MAPATSQHFETIYDNEKKFCQQCKCIEVLNLIFGGWVIERGRNGSKERCRACSVVQSWTLCFSDDDYALVCCCRRACLDIIDPVSIFSRWTKSSSLYWPCAVDFLFLSGQELVSLHVAKFESIAEGCFSPSLITTYFWSHAMYRMDARQSIKRLLKGKPAPSYYKRLSHVRNKSSLVDVSGFNAGAGNMGRVNSGSYSPTGPMGDELNGLLGDDIHRDQLLRIVHKEVLDTPDEQEVLFLGAVHKGKASKYHIGGLVGAASGERSRYLCIALETGSRPHFEVKSLDSCQGQEDRGRDGPVSPSSSFSTPRSVSCAGSECFVVVYYFTMAAGAMGADVQVTVKSDVYLNDLSSVEYGPGTDFTLTFEQDGAPGNVAKPHYQLAALTQAFRDEIVWNILTIADVCCQVQPKTQGIDLHGLGLTASAQNFLSRNEALGRFLVIALDFEKEKWEESRVGGIARGKRGGDGAALPGVLMEAVWSSQARDQELEGLLDRFQWPTQTVEEIDGQLSERLKGLESDTMEVLLSWESAASRRPSTMTGAQDGGKGPDTASPAPPPLGPAAPGVDGEGEGYLSTLKLVEMLEELAQELAEVEAWLAGKGEALTRLQTDMQEIEEENNRLERQWKNFSRLNAVLQPLVQELSLDHAQESLLRDPVRFLDGGTGQLPPGEGAPEPGRPGGQKGGGMSASETSALVEEKVAVVVAAAQVLHRGLALLEGREVLGAEDRDGSRSPATGEDVMAFHKLSLSSSPTRTGNRPWEPVKVSVPPVPDGRSSSSSRSPLPPSQPASTPVAGVAPLKTIPRRLMDMTSLRSRSSYYADLRAVFLERVLAYLSSLFPACTPAGRLPNPVAPGHGGSRGNQTLAQELADAQRAFHTQLLDYEPLVEVVVGMLQGVPKGPGWMDGLLHRYSEAGSSGLYRPFLKAYFAELHAKTQTQGGTGNSGWFEGGVPAPSIFSNQTTASMAALPRAHINDFGSQGVVAFPPPSLRGNGSEPMFGHPKVSSSIPGAATSYYQQQACLLQQERTGGKGMGLTRSMAIDQACAELVPVVRREQHFIVELFKLQVDDSEDLRKLQSVLEVEFDKLRDKLKEQAEAAMDADPIEGLAVVAVVTGLLGPKPGSPSGPRASYQGGNVAGRREQEDEGRKPTRKAMGHAMLVTSQDSFMLELLISLQRSLGQKFHTFVADQEVWINHQNPDIKRAGVLAPFAKFPIFVDRLALAVGGQMIGIAEAALQQLSSSLLAWLERLSLRGDQKYADVVRLENYHFFVQTMSPRQQCLIGSDVLVSFIDQAQAAYEAAVQRYASWSLGYAFPEVTAFFGSIDDLIVKVGVGDVSIHVPKTALFKLTQEACSRKAIADSLRTAFRRLRKHISDDSGLFLPLWDRISLLLYQRFVRYEDVILQCYDVKLEPPAILVRQLAQECRTQASK